MSQNIKKIKNMVHPEASKVREQVKTMDIILRTVQVLLLVSGFVLGIAMAIHLSEYASEHGGYDDVVEYTVNFFGYHLEVESDTFLGSPFMMFLFVSAGFDLVVLLLDGMRIYMRSMLTAKAEMLDTTYKTELLTALLVMQGNNSGENDGETDGLADSVQENNESPVDAFIQSVEKSVEDEQEVYQKNASVGEEDYVFCRYCGVKQRANRSVCWSCGLEINVPAEKK